MGGNHLKPLKSFIIYFILSIFRVLFIGLFWLVICSAYTLIFLNSAQVQVMSGRHEPYSLPRTVFVRWNGLPLDLSPELRQISTSAEDSWRSGPTNDFFHDLVVTTEPSADKLYYVPAEDYKESKKIKRKAQWKRVERESLRLPVGEFVFAGVWNDGKTAAAMVTTTASRQMVLLRPGQPMRQLN